MGLSSNLLARTAAWRGTVPLALAGGVGTLLVSSSSRYVQGGDSSEFALVFHEGGVPHPPGFPVYVAWLRAMRLILGAVDWPRAPAHAAAVATAALAVPASLLFFAAARAWGAHRHLALLGTIALLTWSRSYVAFTHPEVWPMVATLACAILWAAAPGQADGAGALPRGVRRVLLLGLLGGLGVATHSTLVLLAPIGLWGVVAGLRESTGARARAAVCGVGGFLAGLAPYLLLLATARDPRGRWVWNDPSTPERLFHHVLRSDYGALELSPVPGESRGAANVVAWLQASVGDGMVVAALLIAALGAWALAIRRASGPDEPAPHATRGAWIALGASWLLSGPLFFSIFNSNPTGLGLASVSQCYLLPGVLVVLALVVVASPAWRRSPRTTAVVAVGLVVLNGWRGQREAARRHTSVIEDYLVDTAGALPPRAVLFMWGDTRSFGFNWLTRATGTRPDVEFVSLALLQRDFYRLRVEAALGRRFPIGKSGLYDLVGMIEALVASGRPVFFTEDDLFFNHVASQLPTHPHGTCLRVLGRGQTVPPAHVLERENDHLFAAFRAKPDDARVLPNTWAAWMYSGYSRTWLMIADRFDEENDPGGSRRVEVRGRAWQTR